MKTWLTTSGIATAVILGATLLASPAHAAPVSEFGQTESIKELRAIAAQADTSALAAYPTCNDYYYVPVKNSTVSAQFPYFSTVRAGSSLSCVLETGNTGNGVRALQNTLNRCYGKGLATDGVFGNGTYNALLQVQRLAGTTVDGVYGPGTRNAIRWLAGDGVCRPGSQYGGF